MSNPSEPPPSYEAAINDNNQASSSSRPQAQSGASQLQVPGQNDNDISAAARRSMEDQTRSLPKGWVRSYDPESSHQFFVDTTKDPPRSIWVHPYDDEEYMSSLSSEQRERIEEESMHPSSGNQTGKGKQDNTIYDHTDEEDFPAELPPRDQAPEAEGKGKKSLGRRMKDKITGTTHEEREQERARRDQRERELYQKHLAIRQAMDKALQTGQPQLIGRDRDGQDVWLQPPQYRGSSHYPGGYGVSPYGSGGMGGIPGGMYGRGMYGPGYGGGMFAPPGMYARPGMPYGRPYRRGYGGAGGYGMPLAIGGGLLGGALLGGAMF